MDTKMITASEAKYKALHSKKEEMFSDTIKIIDRFIKAKCMDGHQSIDLKISKDKIDKECCCKCEALLHKLGYHCSFVERNFDFMFYIRWEDA